MRLSRINRVWLLSGLAAAVAALAVWGLMAVKASSAQKDEAPRDDKKDEFAALMAKMKADKPKIAEKHKALLEKRYDLADKPMKDVKQNGGKAVQGGVRVLLADGMTWDKLAGMTPEQIKSKKLYPAGFLPLPHPDR